MKVNKANYNGTETPATGKVTDASVSANVSPKYVLPTTFHFQK